MMTYKTVVELVEHFDRTCHLCPPATAQDIVERLCSESGDEDIDLGGSDGVIRLDLNKTDDVTFEPHTRGFSIRII